MSMYKFVVEIDILKRKILIHIIHNIGSNWKHDSSQFI